ncbi:MAG: hypothetical protein JJ916_07950 [Phycisphaerales bacterium]|nr:hypothetical protein [Phycisphaerales bacterium]
MIRTTTSRADYRPALMLALLSLVLVGCQKTALRPDDQRSQFDRYDQSRSQRAQPYLEDEFGRRTPNLKDRLLVRDE